jgi:hypothetical protein
MIMVEIRSVEMKHKTIRELGGEIWAEIFSEMQARPNDRRFKIEDISTHTVDALMDLIMGVLARHEGSVITNDKDLPVEPIPMKNE